MKIVDVVCAPGRTGFFFDDQKAIKSGAVSDGAAYIGTPVTPGFKSIRQAGESISVMLVLEDGQIAWGDCAAVQYSGAGGRDPLFLAEDFIPVIDKYIKPALVGKEADNFRELTKMMETLSPTICEMAKNSVPVEFLPDLNRSVAGTSTSQDDQLANFSMEALKALSSSLKPKG